MHFTLSIDCVSIIAAITISTICCCFVGIYVAIVLVGLYTLYVIVDNHLVFIHALFHAFHNIKSSVISTITSSVDVGRSIIVHLDNEWDTVFIAKVAASLVILAVYAHFAYLVSNHRPI